MATTAAAAVMTQPSAAVAPPEVEQGPTASRPDNILEKSGRAGTFYGGKTVPVF